MPGQSIYQWPARFCSLRLELWVPPMLKQKVGEVVSYLLLQKSYLSFLVMRGNLDNSSSPLLPNSEKAEAARGAEAQKASFADPNGHVHDSDANPRGPAEATAFLSTVAKLQTAG